MKLKIFIVCIVLFLTGCTGVPKNVMKLSENHMAEKQIQSRKYETNNEKKVMAAVVGVMQDIGFILDKNNTELGFVSVSKKTDATRGGQVAGALALDILSALGGRKGDQLGNIDDVQKVNATVVVKSAIDKSGIIVRITYQRMVWNKKGELSRVETLKDEEMYKLFFEKLSKSIFLEEHQI